VGKDADARSDAERSGCARAWKGGVGWPYALRLEDSSLTADERLLDSARPSFIFGSLPVSDPFSSVILTLDSSYRLPVK
jgi:hypothetical protein